MTKHDRAKMEARFNSRFRLYPERQAELADFVAREVDRAVRAKRRAQKLAAEEAAKWRAEAERMHREAARKATRR
jgi:hypothetical protein